MLVNILAKDAASLQGEEFPANISVLQASQGELEWTKEIHKNYDLMVVGLPRKTALMEFVETEFIQMSPVPVLGIFAALPAGGSSNRGSAPVATKYKGPIELPEVSGSDIV